MLSTVTSKAHVSKSDNSVYIKFYTLSSSYNFNQKLTHSLTNGNSHKYLFALPHKWHYFLPPTDAKKTIQGQDGVHVTIINSILVKIVKFHCLIKRLCQPTFAMALSIARISDMILWCTASTERMLFTSDFKLSYNNSKQVLLRTQQILLQRKHIKYYYYIYF